MYYFLSASVLRSFSDHILKPSLTEPVRLFVIPALAALPNLPYCELLASLHQPGEQPSLSLLYAVLALERSSGGEFSQSDAAFIITVVLIFQCEILYLYFSSNYGIFTAVLHFILVLNLSSKLCTKEALKLLVTSFL